VIFFRLRGYIWDRDAIEDLEGEPITGPCFLRLSAMECSEKGVEKVLVD